jgi:hypothetical protein
MMAKDKSILQKEIIRNDANRRRRAAFQKTWRSPVHGFTPRPPTLEGMPSPLGMMLGIASSAVGTFGGGGQVGMYSPDYVTNPIPTLPSGMTDWSKATVIGP